MIGLTIHHNPLTHLTVSTLVGDGPQAVWAMPNQYPDVRYSTHTHPTPPLRNLLFKTHPHGVLDTGPLPRLGNNLIKAGVTAYSNRFLSGNCVKVGIAGVGYVICGGRGM
jgi:hypothetical protein